MLASIPQHKELRPTGAYMTKLHRRLIAQLCEQVLQRKFCLESLWQEGTIDKISSTEKMHFDTTVIYHQSNGFFRPHLSGSWEGNQGLLNFNYLGPHLGGWSRSSWGFYSMIGAVIPGRGRIAPSFSVLPSTRHKTTHPIATVLCTLLSQQQLTLHMMTAVVLLLCFLGEILLCCKKNHFFSSSPSFFTFKI